MYMRRLGMLGVVCSVLLVMVAAALAQQPGPTVYRTALYMRVPADKESDYLEFVRTNTRKMIQLRMESGGVLSWALLKLVYEGSPALDYNYVATTLYAGPPTDLTEAERDQLFRRATGASYQEYQQKIAGLRTSVGSMLGSVQAFVPGTEMREGNYVSLSRWKIQPQQGAAYSDYLQTMLLPLQIQNFKDGHHVGWTAGRLMYPGGGDAPFDVTIATVHKDLASAVTIPSPDEMAARFAKAHPDKSYDTFMDHGRAVRRLVRTELLKVMIADQASEQTSSTPDRRTPGAIAGTP